MTYALLSLAGGGSFLLPGKLHVPEMQVTPAAEPQRSPASTRAARGTTDDVAADGSAMIRATRRDEAHDGTAPVS